MAIWTIIKFKQDILVLNSGAKHPDEMHAIVLDQLCHFKGFLAHQ